MKTLAFAVAVMFAACLSLADTLTTLDGKTYTDVELITNRCDMISITFSHSKGITKINYEDMVERDKAKYGYNSEKVKACLAAQEKRKADERAKIEDENRVRAAFEELRRREDLEAKEEAANQKRAAEQEGEKQPATNIPPQNVKRLP
jgi:hypothetical protein